MNSYYPIPEVATAKSLEALLRGGVVIRMGFTFSVSSISQWKRFTRGGSGIV